MSAYYFCWGEGREKGKEARGEGGYSLSTAPLIGKIGSCDCIGEESYGAVYTCQSEDLFGANAEGFVEDCCFLVVRC